MRFDLHCHTTASDGVLSPAELVRRAAEKQVEVLAVTDHDTLAGLDEVRRTIEAEQLPLRLVSGVEISTGWEHHEIHIVALGVDEKIRSCWIFWPVSWHDVRRVRWKSGVVWRSASSPAPMKRPNSLPVTPP